MTSILIERLRYVDNNDPCMATYTIHSNRVTCLELKSKLISTCSIFTVMLILDETTLFFFNLRAPTHITSSQRLPGLIESWVARVPSGAPVKKGLKAMASVILSSTLAGSKTAKSRTTSSNSVGISSASEPPSTIAVNELGGLFDENESDEREAAMSSPIKGKTRVTSAVCLT